MAKKIVIASGKGGVGKSSLTVGLCRALQQMDKRVLAIDCDIGLRSLDVLLRAGSELVFDWGDVLDEVCEPQKALIETDGVFLLAAPLTNDPDYTPARMREMVALFEDDYDYILIDAPAGVVGEFNLAAAMADSGIVVATPDALCIRSASRTANTLNDFNIEDLRLVLNRFQRAAVERSFLLNIDDAIDRSGIRLLGVVPEDPEVTFRLPKGQPLPKKSLAGKAFARIARRIDGEDVPLRIL